MGVSNANTSFWVSVLQMPLVWPFKLLDTLRIGPRESLGTLVFVPVWFIYWTGLGALFGFLLQLLFRFSTSRKERANATTETIKQQPVKRPDSLRFLYIVGFFALGMFFTLAKREFHGWKSVVFVLLWLFLIGTVSLPLLRLTRRFPPIKPYSNWCLIHAALEIVPIALLFSPTLVNFYMFAFPAPATLALIAFFFLPEYRMQGGLLWGNILIAFGGFICFWFAVTAARFIQRSQKLKKETNDQMSPLGPIMCIIVIGAGLFGGVGWFLYRMFSGLAGSGP